MTRELLKMRLVWGTVNTFKWIRTSFIISHFPYSLGSYNTKSNAFRLQYILQANTDLEVKC